MNVARTIDEILIELEPALRSNIADLAESLKGPPNKALSNRTSWRWGAKGSFRIRVSGAKQGACADFGGSFKGGPLALVMHERGCDFRDAVLWGAARYGIATEGQTAAPIDLAAMLARDAERKAERDRKQAEADADEGQRIVAARRMWEASTLLSGTVAERYLIAARGIQRPAGGWPEAVRYHPASRALILAGTDADGAVQFVQRVRLTADGRKIDGSEALPVKQTSGVMAGAFVRLPGAADGPLLLAEGPETGLSVWAATRAETWLSIGTITRHEPLTGRRVIVCRDDDAHQSSGDKALKLKTAEWQSAGLDVSVATPWTVRRCDKSDFNDVMLAGGADAVRVRIDATLKPVFMPVRRVPVHEAREQLAAAPTGPHYRRPTMEADAASRRLHKIAGAILDRVERHLDARDWIKTKAAELLATTDPARIEATRVRRLAELLAAGLTHQAANAKAATAALGAVRGVATRKAKRAAAAVFGARAASGAMPRIQIKGAAGLGKTEAFIDAYLRRPGLWNRHINVFCKTLELALGFAAKVAEKLGEITRQPNGAGPRVVVIQGRQSKEMCHSERLKVVTKAKEKGVHSVFRACCHQPAREGAAESFCPFWQPCGYIAQFRDQSPALRIMAHARMRLNQPDELSLPKADMVIVDETAIATFATHGKVDPAALTDRASYAVAKGQDESIIQESLDLGAAVLGLIQAPDMLQRLGERGHTPELFRAAADAAALAADAAAPDLRPGMDPTEAVRRCDAVKVTHPGKSIASLFGQIARDLEAKRRVSNGIEWDAKHTATAEDGTKLPHPIIRVHGPADAVQAPKDTALLLLDADASLAINRRLFGDDLRGFTVQAARLAHVTQVIDHAVTKGSIVDDERLPNNRPKAEKLRARIAAMVQREVARNGGQRVLIVTPRKVRLAMTGEADTTDLPPSTVWLGADMTHYGRHLGANRWADFDTVIVLGREQLPPLEAERLARAIYANAPDIELDLPGSYVWKSRRHDLRTGTAEPVKKVQVHPDNRVQELLEMTRENAMGQGLDRLRLIHRKADRPARVLVVSNLPVPGLVVDQLLTLDDMLKGGTVWERALARMPDGVLPVAVDWLVENLGDLFTSVRTAERAVATLIPPLGNRDTYCQVAVLRLAGSTRRNRALIRHDVTDARAQSARLLGAEIVEFKMVGEVPPEPPEPPGADLVPVVEPVIELPVISFDALSPALMYRRGVLEPPPADMLTVRGWGGVPIARIEVPMMGGFMCATAVSRWGFDVPMVMVRPVWSENRPVSGYRSAAGPGRAC